MDLLAEVEVAEAAAEAGLDAPVPTCPGWQVRELVQHIGVTHRWAAANAAEPEGRQVRLKDLLTEPVPDGEELVPWLRAGYAALHDTLADGFPAQAPYAVALAYRVRYSMQVNAREAMHMLELRTTPQGHPSYRHVCQEMHRLIAEQAGHHAVAAMMHYVDHSPEPALERLEAERRAESRRRGL